MSSFIHNIAAAISLTGFVFMVFTLAQIAGG